MKRENPVWRLHSLMFIAATALWFSDPGIGWSRSDAECVPRAVNIPLCREGKLADWRAFVTANGTLGGAAFPQCVAFDADGDGVPTESIRVRVGRIKFRASEEAWEGGGIARILRGNGRQVVAAASVAVEYRSSSDRRNLAGGLFELLVDGVVIARHDFGAIATGATLSARLEGRARVPHGPYTLSIRIRRPFQSLPGTPAPYQYVGPVEIMLPPSDCGEHG